MKNWPNPSSLKVAEGFSVTEVPKRHHVHPAPCADAVSAFLEKVRTIESRLHGFRQIDPEQLYAEAAQRDSLAEDARGPLHGQLIAVKEVFDVAGYTCGWGTPIHDGRKPETDAAVVKSLRAAGAIIAGITVSTEYAMANVGPTVNPFDSKCTPGASSQGSAAVVGAGLVDMALGSQTIGSVIRPAAYCGCIGFKPSWGYVDVGGAMPLSPYLDHVGFMTSRVDQVEVLLQILAPSLPAPTRSEPNQFLLLEPWYDDEISSEMQGVVAQSVKVLTRAVCDVQQTSIPKWIAEAEEHVLDTILAYDMARLHGDDFKAHGEMMSARIRDYITRGQEIGADAYMSALSLRETMIDELRTLFDGRSVLSPSAVGHAPLRINGTGSRAPQRIWTLVGFPAISVPFGSVDGMPLGIQISASPEEDYDLLSVAKHLMGVN
jgi:Asp-tRNA(Asn)/Glu-tRNA(Gln) amidotransferase A subunit family amidase